MVTGLNKKARKGNEIEMPARQVVVNELEVIDFNLPDLTLRINCK